MMNLKGRVALVTGVSRRKGIGFAIAQHLARAGAELFIQSWSPFDASMPWGADEIESILAELREVGRVEHLSADFLLPDTPEKLVDVAVSAYGHLDILIANHAYSRDAYLHELTAEHIDKHLLVNVRGSLLLAKAFAAQHDGREGGRFVMLTSGQALSPMPETIAYAASKAAIQGITLTLSSELIKRKITVNSIDPGATDTGWANPEFYETVKALHVCLRIFCPDFTRIGNLLRINFVLICGEFFVPNQDFLRNFCPRILGDLFPKNWSKRRGAIWAISQGIPSSMNYCCASSLSMICPIIYCLTTATLH